MRGCDHCGLVTADREYDERTCPDCGHELTDMDTAEARDLMWQRRVAEQFRRVSRLTRTMEARKSF